MDLFTTQYDEAIAAVLPHLQNYPEMKPFIGKYWDNSNYKILLLGESHFIPGDELSEAYKEKNHVKDWYNNDSAGLHEYYTCHISTRKVVNESDNIEEFKYNGTRLLYYRVKAAIQYQYPELKSEKFVFPYLSYYNYFQRPAFILGASIQNDGIDNQVAYETLKEVTSIINPKKIIFCSSKAFNAFSSVKIRDGNADAFKDITIDKVPHPSSAWWHRKSSACGGRNGLEKFIDILKQ